MTGVGTALTQFMSLLVDGIETLALGIANGVTVMAKALFLDVDTTTGAVTGLSIFGGIVGIFAGIALARKSNGEDFKSDKNGGGLNTNTVLCLQIS